MSTIIHIMGCTCAGKSTLIQKLLTMGSDIAAVEVGKMLRAKYGEDYFKGQAAPAHTADEAFFLYTEGVDNAIAEGANIVLVDGQPRDLKQTRKIVNMWPGHRVIYLLVHADHDVREARARATREPGPNLDLALARLNNDYKNQYTVLTELTKLGRIYSVVDTGDEGFDLNGFCEELVNECGDT